MRTRVHKWGNSLALRIPKPMAEEARLEQDSAVDVSLVDGRIVILPVPDPRKTLEDMLAGVTAQNMHSEVDFGPAVGKEVW